MPPGHRPLSLPQLQTFKGKRCRVLLSNRLVVHGVLADWDQFMNLTLRDCTDSREQNYATAVIRGNAVVTIQ